MIDLGPDKDSSTSKDKKTSKRRYVKPTKEEFEEFLESIDLEFHLEQDSPGQELVYDAPGVYEKEDSVVLRVYSTLDPRTEEARGKGNDAIRCVIVDTRGNYPLHGKKKTLRIETWRKNLRKKIEELSSNSGEYIKMCSECGSLMAIREGKYGEFYGCTSYPSCDNTEDI